MNTDNADPYSKEKIDLIGYSKKKKKKETQWSSQTNFITLNRFDCKLIFFVWYNSKKSYYMIRKIK